MKFDFEVLVVGGGPAGLSAALTLGRISRSTLICDDNRPRNLPSEHVNNFPTRDGVHPAEWRKAARQDLQKYPTIQTFNGQVASVEKLKDGFLATLSDLRKVSIRKVILADGIKDRLPSIPGFKELWGQAIFHCPFCHGFEIRGSKLGYIINNEWAFHALPMIQSLTSDLVLFTNGKLELTADQRKYLDKNKIVVVEDEIDRLQHEGKVLKGISLKNGKVISRQFTFYNPEMPFELKSEIGATLGCEKTEFGLYKVDEMNATTVPGIFAAGDNMTMAQSVLLASASGAKAGIAAIAQLLHKQD